MALRRLRSKTTVLKQGEVIDKKKLIDQHYYAISSKATILKPDNVKGSSVEGKSRRACGVVRRERERKEESKKEYRLRRDGKLIVASIETFFPDWDGELGSWKILLEKLMGEHALLLRFAHDRNRVVVYKDGALQHSLLKLQMKCIFSVAFVQCLLQLVGAGS